MTAFGMPTLIEASRPEEAVRLCATLGLQFVELNMNLPEYQPHHFPLDELKRLSRETGIFYTIHVHENLDAGDFNPNIAKAWLRTMEETIRLARELHAPLVNMHLHQGIYFTLPGRKVYLFERYREEYLSSIRALRACCEQAAGGQLLISVENTDGWLPVQQEAIELLLKSPSFALTYDVGHDYGAAYADQPFLRNHRARLCHMHLHDAGPAGIHLPLGEGALPLPQLLHLAREENCRVVLETKTADALAKSVEWLRSQGLCPWTPAGGQCPPAPHAAPLRDAGCKRAWVRGRGGGGSLD